MAFKQVFYALREVFPQVDLRILKAVASQYSCDVDTAVEFVLSDVLPAVSEPNEPHYTLQAGSSGTFHERNLSLGYNGPLCTNNKWEECPQIEDKSVINETRITPTVGYAQVRASSASSTKPPIVGYEQSSSTTFVNHCAKEQGKMTLKGKKVINQKHFTGNYNLSHLLVTSGSMMPLCMQSPSDCGVECKGKMSLKLPKDESKKIFSCAEDNHSSENSANFCPSEDGHASVNWLGASTMHTHCESQDNYDLQVLFEKERHLKLSEAKSKCHLPKSEDNYNLDALFVEFGSNDDRHTSDCSRNAHIFPALSETEDYDLQVLFENGMSLKLSATQSIHDVSKSQDNYDLQDLFGNVDNSKKESGVLHTPVNTPELYKSENELHQKPCTSGSTTQEPRALIRDENQQSSYKIDDHCTLFDVLASSKLINNSFQIFKDKDNSYKVDSQEQTSMDRNDDLNLRELLSSTPNASVPDLDSKCEVRDEAEKEIMCSNSVDNQSVFLVAVHDTLPYNETKLMPDASNNEKSLDITTQSYHIAGINKLVSDISNHKEALSYLYDLTTTKMKKVELQEETSRKAKEGVVRAHQGLIAMVDNFNQLIKNSEESNEKIKFELDARLATSIKEEAVDREKITQQEKLALLMCKEKEAKMASIMEESMKLQKKAEENTLLRSFLSDCGHTIDILQGEISSIHEKVVTLKERTRSKLQLALVSTSSSDTSSPTSDCKTASPDRHQPLKMMVGSHVKDFEEFSDDEWEMLETTQAYN